MVHLVLLVTFYPPWHYIRIFTSFLPIFFTSFLLHYFICHIQPCMSPLTFWLFIFHFFLFFFSLNFLLHFSVLLFIIFSLLWHKVTSSSYFLLSFNHKTLFLSFFSFSSLFPRHPQLMDFPSVEVHNIWCHNRAKIEVKFCISHPQRRVLA